MIYTTFGGPDCSWWMHRGHGRGRGPRGGRPWWAAVMNDPPPRAERGEIRYLVLEAIASQPRHGYEIIQHIEERTGGAYRPSPGVIYPTLQMLEELGHAHVIEQDGRKVYAITDAGKQELEAHRSAVDDFYGRFEDEPWEAYAEDVAELMRSVGRLVHAFRRGAARGGFRPETLRKIRKVLDDALEQIEDALNRPKR
ncbi:MAG: PadR family transcriptional regulator [Pseudomonadota bacterium]|nr:MAG: PadR family transcriptional regulator [Pseudomonadota bacterium]